MRRLSVRLEASVGVPFLTSQREDGLFSICKECEKADRIKARVRKAAAAAEAKKAAKPKRTRKGPRPDRPSTPEHDEGPRGIGAFCVLVAHPWARIPFGV